MSPVGKTVVPPVPAVVRELCPSCLGIVGCKCSRCHGAGYVFVSPYSRFKGEQAWEGE